MNIKADLPEVSAGYARGYAYAQRCHEEQAGAECQKWLREMVKNEPVTDFDAGVRDYMVTNGLMGEEPEQVFADEEAPAGLIILGLAAVGTFLIAGAKLLGLLP